ncbi:gliding motility-associated C-terminal domain-containing protein, partial [Muricauda oceani]
SGGNTETSETGTTDSFTVVLDAQPVTDVVLDVISGNTNEGTVDVSTLTFTNANWNTAQGVTVTGVDDAVVDGDQTYDITVSVDAGNSDDDFDFLVPQTVSVDNADDDVAEININNPAPVEEGDAGDGPSTINFTVSIDQSDPDDPITVNYEISGGNEDTDTGTLTFTAGTTILTQTIPVTTTGDDNIEADVPVSVTLSNASANANITTTVGSSSFIDDDLAEININNPAPVEEGDAGDGPSTINFTVSIDQSDPEDPITVDYEITGGNEDSDTGTLTFLAGTTTLTQTIPVTTTGDDTIEANVPVSVTLSNASANASIGTATGSSSFTDDDATPVGYTVQINQDPITILNQENVSFTFSGVPLLSSSYDYVFASSGDNYITTVSAGDNIPAFNRTISGIDLSSLPDGNIRILFSITNIFGNEGGDASAFSVKNTAVPSGYTVSIDQDLIDSNNQDDVSFTFAGAEEDATYNYTFSSDGGGANVPGSGQITSASQQISNIDLSGLSDGTITLNVTLSNDNGQGPVASDTSTKSLAVPLGYNVSIDQSVVNFANQSAVGFTFSNAEIGAAYNYTFSSDGGGANVTGSGTIATPNDQISGIDLSGLGDGIITLSVTLSNGNGTGTVVNDTADKDTTVCNAGGSAPTLDTSVSTVFCEIINVNLNDYVTNTNGPAGTTLVWSRNPSPEGVDDHIDNNIEEGSGVYYGFFYDSANDCYSPSLEVELERNFTPVITETTATEICGEGTATLTVTATVGDFSAITYSWFDTLDASALPIASGATFETDTLTETTSFYVSAASNECTSDRVEVIVTVNSAPLAGAPIDGLTACNISSDEGSTTFDLDEGLIGQDPGTWAVINDPSNGEVTIGADNVVDFVDLVSGDYVFEYTTNTVGDCTETATSQITIAVQDCISNEAIDLAIIKTFDGSGSYLLGDEVEFTITLENVDGNTVNDIVITDILDEDFELIDAVATLGSYDPNTGEWTIALLEATEEEATLTIRVRPTEAREFSNTATLVSSVPVDDIPENNSSTVTVTVNRNQCEDPGTICNIFSPNNDGTNDTLKLVGGAMQFPNNTLEIFDRYGNSVFQMDGYDSSWDGTGKNGDLPKGTYFYILDLDTTDGSDDDVVKGWIQIVRDN